MNKSEYNYCKSIFVKSGFHKVLFRLSKKMQDKKVIFYSNGAYFCAMCDLYDLKKLFPNSKVCDLKYQSEQTDEFKNFKTVKPTELKDICFDYIIITSQNSKTIFNYLTKELKVKRKKIIELNKKTFIKGILGKIPLFVKYFSLSKNIFTSLKYLLFCNNGELLAKINYFKKLKSLKNKEKIKVAFVCEENQKWGYTKLYKLFLSNSRFEVLPVILYPIITSSRVEFTQKANFEFFKNEGIEALDGYDYKNDEIIPLESFQPDLVFYQQPWYLNNLNHPQHVSEFALTLMSPYGFTTLGEKNWGSDLVKAVYSSLWMFFSETKYHLNFYKKAANMRFKDNLYPSGSVKLDAYFSFDKTEVSNLWKGEGKRIIYAPHHSIFNNGLKMSTFHKNFKFFLDFAKTHPSLSFIFKPHPALKNACVQFGLMSEVKYNNYLDEWRNLPNSDVYEGGRYFELFKTSDVLVTDASSFPAEYFPTRKPIIFLERKDKAPLDAFGKKLFLGIYSLYDICEFENLLNKILFVDDSLKPVREKIFKQCFNDFSLSASEKIEKFILGNIS